MQTYRDVLGRASPACCCSGSGGQALDDPALLDQPSAERFRAARTRKAESLTARRRSGSTGRSLELGSVSPSLAEYKDQHPVWPKGKQPRLSERRQRFRGTNSYGNVHNRAIGYVQIALRSKWPKVLGAVADYLPSATAICPCPSSNSLPTPARDRSVPSRHCRGDWGKARRLRF